jgi:3-hydroxyisobutyrate dehydrogenase-like beta-hydroxyacid dehydrogenase
VNVVIGLGNLGSAFALRLSQTAGETVGVDPSAATRAAFESRGGAAMESLENVPWPEVDTVFVVVRLVDQALEVLRGIAAGAVRPVRVFVVTTLDPRTASGLRDLETPLLRIIESPISGGDQGALAGSLSVIVGGDVRDDDIPFLRATVAGSVTRFDALGQATLAKLMNNAVMAANALVLADAIVAAGGAGIEPSLFLDLVCRSSGGSRAADKFMRLDATLLAKDAALLMGTDVKLSDVEVLDDLVRRSRELETSLGDARGLLA